MKPLTMEVLLWGTDEHPLTDVEMAIVEQKDLKPLTFAGMDKTGRGVCVKFANGRCEMGELCPLRHLTKYKPRRLVCRHWPRGLCMSGDRCEFLHEYVPSLMPECVFFSTNQLCNNPDCEFRHVDPSSKPPAVMGRRGECRWYKRGFCRHGPHCPLDHVRREMCPYYFAGFCPHGPSCKLEHPSFALSVALPLNLIHIICFNCHERGHKMVDCPTLPGCRPMDDVMKR